MSVKKTILAAIIAAMGAAGTASPTYADGIGGNVEGTSEYTRTTFFSNAVFDSRGFAIQGQSYPMSNPVGTLGLSATSGNGVVVTFTPGSGWVSPLAGNTGADAGKEFYFEPGVKCIVTASTSTTACTVNFTGTASGLSYASGTWAAGVSLDDNGYPLIASQMVLTTQPGSSGQDGQLTGAGAVYYLNYKSTGQAVAVSISGTGSVGVTFLGTTLLPDGLTTRVQFSLATAATASFYFSGQVWDVDCARDGSTSSAGQPLFTNAFVQHLARFRSLRLMDFLGTNNRLDTTWGTRPPNYAMARAAYMGCGKFSWEMAFNLLNAVLAWPGSKLQQVWINIPANVDNTDPVNSYVAQLASLRKSMLSPTLQVIVENSNEPWNGIFKAYPTYGTLAAQEAQIIAINGYGQTPNGHIVSMSGDGSTITVGLSQALPSWLTVGAQFVANNLSASTTYGSLASPLMVTAVDTVGNTFSYAGTLTSFTITNSWAFWFGLSSTLTTDNTGWNAYSWPLKWGVRKTWQNQQLWVQTNPTDRWVLNVALWGKGNGNSNSALPVQFAYGNWLGGGAAGTTASLKTWCWGVACAPYQATSVSNATVSDALATLNAIIATGSNADGGELEARNHVYSCTRFGVVPLAYECGPATDNTHSFGIALNTDPGMGTFVTAMLDMHFRTGFRWMHYYNIGVGAFQNATNAGWYCAQSYDDLTSPKLAALLAYSTPKDFADPRNGVQTTASYQYVTTASSGGQANSSTGMYYWYANTGLRSIEWQQPFHGYTALTVQGSGGTTSTAAEILIDEVLIGTVTIPAGGAGSSNSATVETSDSLPLGTIADGSHNIAVRFPTSTGAVGVLGYTLH